MIAKDCFPNLFNERESFFYVDKVITAYFGNRKSEFFSDRIMVVKTDEKFVIAVTHLVWGAFWKKPFRGFARKNSRLLCTSFCKCTIYVPVKKYHFFA